MHRRFVTGLALLGLALAACAPRVAPADAAAADGFSEDRAIAARDAEATEDGAAQDSAADALVADASDDSAPALDAMEAGPSGPFVAPDFTLPDLNPNSPTHRMDVSPRALRGRVTAWYFGTST